MTVCPNVTTLSVNTEYVTFAQYIPVSTALSGYKENSNGIAVTVNKQGFVFHENKDSS